MPNDNVSELDPNQIIRLRQGRKYFGFGPTQLDLKIKSGEVPKPLALSDTGHAKGWLGSQIIAHQRKLLEAAAKQAEAPRPASKRKRA